MNKGTIIGLIIFLLAIALIVFVLWGQLDYIKEKKSFCESQGGTFSQFGSKCYIGDDGTFVESYEVVGCGANKCRLAKE